MRKLLPYDKQEKSVRKNYSAIVSNNCLRLTDKICILFLSQPLRVTDRAIKTRMFTIFYYLIIFLEKIPEITTESIILE